MSKLEDKTYSELKNIFGFDVERNVRPDWLMSKNGGRLELDIFIPKANLAAEIQGDQHYAYTPFFHKTYNDFLNQKNRDKEKQNICKKTGVRLFYIHDEIDLKKFKSIAINEIKSTGQRAFSCINKYAYIEDHLDKHDFSVLLDFATKRYIKTNRTKIDINKTKKYIKYLVGSIAQDRIHLRNQRKMTYRLIYLYIVFDSGIYNISQNDVSIVYADCMYQMGIKEKYSVVDMYKKVELLRKQKQKFVYRAIFSETSKYIDWYMAGHGYQNWFSERGINAFEKKTLSSH